MRIVMIVAGAGGMYCGACLHAATLVRALRHAHHDALLVPAYTPVRIEEEIEAGSVRRVVFGGLNVYLQQKWAWARHLPAWLDRLLDHPGLLRRLGRRVGTTDPKQLGPLCVSMLRGEQGRQCKELIKLLDWLRSDVRPDVVHLSTVLLAAVARPIADALNVPVIGTLSGEDGFVEGLAEPYRAEAREVLSARCRELAALVALNQYYASRMADYLAVDRSKIHVIPPGLELAGHRPLEAASRTEADSSPQRSWRIGFLGRVCADKGLHLLAEAFVRLAQKPDLPPLAMAAAGYLADADRGYLRQVESFLDEAGLGDRFAYQGCLDRAEKIAFLQSIDVLSTPSVMPESKALPVLEAWANAVPVVAPAHGAFAELVEHTQGGILCEPNNAAALAEALNQLAQNPAHARQLGRRGQIAVYQHYHAARMAQDTLQLYQYLLRR